MSNTISPNQLINQMRMLAAQAQAGVARPNLEGGMPTGNLGQVGGAQKPSFDNALVKALDSVNATQKSAAEMANRFEKGDPNVELVDVMVTLQKSAVAFEATTQVRNKLVSAYQEIMNMPV